MLAYRDVVDVEDICTNLFLVTAITTTKIDYTCRTGSTRSWRRDTCNSRKEALVVKALLGKAIIPDDNQYSLGGLVEPNRLAML